MQSARGDEVKVPETPRSARRLRVVVAALVSVGLLVPVAALGAGTSGQTASAAQYKITICHHTHSKKHPFVTIRISNKAWPAHQRHGDTMGACATTKAKHGKGHHNGDKGKSHQKGNKPADKGNNGKSGTNPSNAQAQSPNHASDHASEHAKSHVK